MAKSRLSNTVDDVLKEIDGLQKEMQKVGKKAFQEGDYIRTKLLIETSTRMDLMKDRINDIGKEMNDLHREVAGNLKGMPAGKTRRTTKRIPRGKKTPESDYKTPILSALMELDGKGKTSEVLDRVYTRMKSKLNDFDRQPVPSVPSQQRWRHTAQIVRNKMIKEGLIKKNSPRGIWEISDLGKKGAGSKTTSKKAPAKKKGTKKKGTKKKGTRKKGTRKSGTTKKASAKKETSKKSTPKVETSTKDTKKE